MENSGLATGVIRKLIEKNRSVSVAESCTGGLLSKYLTDVSGASGVFRYGAVVYNETIKQTVLGVKPETLGSFTVYSPQVAEEMADGVRRISDSYYGAGITGVAGPGPDGDVPAGTVFVCVKTPYRTVHKTLHSNFTEDIRNSNREAAIAAVLGIITEDLNDG